MLTRFKCCSTVQGKHAALYKGKAMQRIKTLYTCVVCGKSWGSKQSLRAHMKVHKDVPFKDFHVRLPKDAVEQFEAVCEKHKTTTCSLVFALMQAAVKGEESGLVNVAASNPLIVQVNHFFATRPRGHGKYSPETIERGLSEQLLEPLLDPRGKSWPPSCQHANEFFKATREVGCLQIRDFVSLEKCWRCYLQGDYRRSGGPAQDSMVLTKTCQ